MRHASVKVAPSCPGFSLASVVVTLACSFPSSAQFLEVHPLAAIPGEVVIYGTEERYIRRLDPVGDVNGDGFGDILVEVRENRENTVDGYGLIFGTSDPPPIFDLGGEVGPGPNTRFSFESESSWGAWPGSRDINNDGRADLHFTSATNVVFTILGRSNWPPQWQLAAADADVVFRQNLSGNLGPVDNPSRDYDGDGNSDLAITSYIGLPHGELVGGRYILRAKSNWPALVEVTEDTDLYWVRGSDEQRFGGEIGNRDRDVNGDGRTDLVFRVRSRSDDVAYFPGAVSIIFGRDLLPLELRLGDGHEDVHIRAEHENDEFGQAIVFGDWNDDGLLDMAVSAPLADGPGDRREDAGTVYLFFDVATAGTNLDLVLQSADVTIHGASAYDTVNYVNRGDSLGDTVVVGDFNGDSIDDLAVAAPGADRPDQATLDEDAGGAYLFYGKNEWPAVIDLAQRSADTTIFGGREENLTKRASSVSRPLQVLDVNADGLDDLLVHGTTMSRMSIILGATPLPKVIDLGNDEFDFALYDVFPTVTNVDIFDANRDGIDDVAVLGGLMHGPDGTRRNAGAIHIIYGKRAPAVTYAYCEPVSIVPGDGSPEAPYQLARRALKFVGPGGEVRLFPVNGATEISAPVTVSKPMRIDSAYAP